MAYVFAAGKESTKRLSGFTWMSVGTLIVFTSLVIMNELGELPKPEAHVSTASFDVKQAKPKPKPKQKVEKAKPRKPSAAKAPPPALAGLGSGIGGLDLGLPGFDLGMGNVGDELLGSMDDVVMTADTVDVLPQATRQTPINVPDSIRRKGVTGYVTVSMLVNEQGQVKSVDILESQPAGVFDDLVTASVQSWTFRPAQYKGKNVSIRVEQTLSFQFQ